MVIMNKQAGNVYATTTFLNDYNVQLISQRY